MPSLQKTFRSACILAGLPVLAFLVYLPVADHGFILLDDPAYLLENPAVRGGLTLSGLKWAFRTAYTANWHPLTWISHMVDVELFGMDAGRHHLVSVLLHAGNGLLLFYLLRDATGALWESAAASALFLVHPLHVESVAWAAERKDLLCGFFFFLSMWTYIAWARKKTTARYVLAALFQVLALLAKPMAVTLPLVFLLLDAWPLGRVGAMRTDGRIDAFPTIRRLLAEKIPFFLLTGVSCAVTYVAQQTGGAVRTFDPYPLGVRIANAALSYAGYLHKTAVPLSLGVYYPHPWDVNGAIPPLGLAVASAVLAALTYAALRARRKYPYLAFGWAWYALTLVPVIGIVQVGDQAMADRYTYLPLVGVFIAVAWGGGEAVRHLARPFRFLPVAVFIAALAACALLARMQVGYWKDSFTLFRHTLEVTSKNWLIHYNLGWGLQARGECAEAAAHYREVLRIRPSEPSAWNNLGMCLSRLGSPAEAAEAYRRALAAKPDYVEAYSNLGNALMDLKDPGEAILQYRRALALRPDDGISRFGLAEALDAAGKPGEAIAEYLALLGAEPENADAHNNLGILLARTGSIGEGIRHFREAIRVRPGHPGATANLLKIQRAADRRETGRPAAGEESGTRR